MRSTELLECAQQLQAIAQSGLTFTDSHYDVERYEEVRRISVRLLEALTDKPHEKIVRVFASETGYATPKVDVRAVVFRGVDEVLLVRESSDGGRWTLPGGWADIGCTPFEVAVKEAREETGLEVEPLRLLALLDKRKHAHPPQPWYVYKAFIECRAVAGELLHTTSETTEARWFARDQLQGLDLSLDRTTPEQLEMVLRYAADPNLHARCD